MEGREAIESVAVGLLKLVCVSVPTARSFIHLGRMIKEGQENTRRRTRCTALGVSSFFFLGPLWHMDRRAPPERSVTTTAREEAVERW
mmetsp:Transcript_1452/g.4961  ORF Transcript_1452/g.4961 Transcript_1452/m.4961 type:complete len:88 (+) Transcript_1452:366-629(+)